MTINYFNNVDATYTITAKRNNDTITLFGKISDYTIEDPATVNVIRDNLKKGGDSYPYFENITEGQTMQLMVVNFENDLHLKKFNDWFWSKEPLEVIGVSGDDSTSRLVFPTCFITKKVMSAKASNGYVTELNFKGSGLEEIFE